MKKKDKQALREKSPEELTVLLKKKKDELFEIKLDKAQKKLKNTKLLFFLRKEIALIMTIISEKAFVTSTKKEVAA